MRWLKTALFTKKTPLPESFYDDLIKADFSTSLADSIISSCKTYQSLESFLESSISNATFHVPESSPHIHFLCGVNGCGKTTTIAKLSSYLLSQGKKVSVIAADTFRASAVKQLELWIQKINSDMVTLTIPESDKESPSTTIYRGLSHAKEISADHIIIDTAGRVYNNLNLMNELAKSFEISKKVMSCLPHSASIVLDSTTGQNIIKQYQEFANFVPINNIILSKFDASAKPGCVFSLLHETKAKISYVGYGEDLEHFQPFKPEDLIAKIGFKYGENN